MKKNIGKNRSFSKEFIVFFILFLLLSVFIFQYLARIHNEFGFRQFSNLSIESCREPLILHPDIFSNNTIILDDWNKNEIKESGFSLITPNSWKVDNSCGKPFCVSSPDISFYPVEKGARISVTMYLKTLKLPSENWMNPDNLYEVLQSFFSCKYLTLNDQPTISSPTNKEKTRTAYYVEGKEANYILITEVWSPELESVTRDILKTFTSGPIQEKIIGNTGPYNRMPPSNIPYRISFEDMQIQNKKVLNGIFSSKTIGYTFTANKNDFMTFRLLEQTNIDMLSETSMELYGYGPTAIKKENYLEFRVPITGRYFLVLINNSAKENRPFQMSVSITR